MKLTNTQSMKAKSGMTLLELTVVILVLLSLISILFIGARAWKKGSDRSANILNIRNTQQAMRGHQNTKELKTGDGFATADLVAYMKLPGPIGDNDVTYTPGTLITGQSNGTTYAHIWLQPSAAGLPAADYGQKDLASSDGW